MAQAPNDVAAEKSGSAEHDDGATTRYHQDSNSPVYVGASHCLGRGTHPGDRAIIRHDEVHRQRCGWAASPLTIDSLLVRRGSTAATPSGLMLKAKNINGSLPGFPLVHESVRS
jgi:hypothetical protein